MMQICAPQAWAVVPKNATISAVLMFGVSVLDTGNNNILITLVKSNFSPYGRDFLGGKSTGRFTNGKLISDFFGSTKKNLTSITLVTFQMFHSEELHLFALFPSPLNSKE